MPELPEVEYTRRLLRPAMLGHRVEQVILRRADLRYAFLTDFAARLEGQTVTALNRRAKYLVAELSSGDLLVMHLGMSGWFRVLKSRDADAGELDKHDHVIFEMSSGRTVVFNDQRRFGFMRIVPGAATAGVEWHGGAIGPEPLDKSFNAETLAKALRGRKTTLKAALIDQKVVGGLGNIYVCEALHRAGLSPRRRASTLVSSRLVPHQARLKAAATYKRSPARTAAPVTYVELLVEAIKDTLRDAIRHQHRPGGPARFLVYDREGERCLRRNCRGTIKRIVHNGRSTFFCPECQV